MFKAYNNKVIYISYILVINFIFFRFFVKTALEEAASSIADYNKDTFKKFLQFCTCMVTIMSTSKLSLLNKIKKMF